MTAALAMIATRLWGATRRAEPDADDALAARAGAGDRGAYEALYRRHLDFVWRRLTRLIGPDPDREDLAQQIFLEVYRGLDKFRGEAQFRTFLYRVVVNTAIDHLRTRRRRPLSLPPEAFADEGDADLTPEQRAAARQTLAEVCAMLDRIKPKKRVAFVLRVVEGLPLQDVATLVGASVPTVAQRVRHAHAELQVLLDRRRTRP